MSNNNDLTNPDPNDMNQYPLHGEDIVEKTAIQWPVVEGLGDPKHIINNFPDIPKQVPISSSAVQFESVLNARLQTTKQLLGNKAAEYAAVGNRYHNFDKAAAMNGITPHRALWGMLTKHLISVMDFLDNPESVTKAHYDEKIGDCLAYFHLLEGLMDRTNTNKEEV